jgi:hypothetical protein
MTKLVSSILIMTATSFAVFSQSDNGPQKAAPAVVAVVAADPALETARAAVTAHGGEKVSRLKTLVLKGSVGLSVFGQNQPATFYTAISGDKYIFEIQNPMQPLKQVFDGTNTVSSIQGFSLPPVTSLGFPVLSKIGSAGYRVSSLEASKKKKGFRVTTPEGYYTDFFVNDKTGQIRGYESSYEVSGRVVTTSVEIDEMKTVEGIVVPSKYSQRFDLGGMTAYANFRAREILVNSEIEDSVFSTVK